MNYSDYRFTLDIHSTQSQISIPVAFNDTARRLCISLSDGVKPYDITDGCIATFVGHKSDGNPFFNSCIIENNKTIVYEFTPQTTSAEGIVDCEIRLYGTDGQLLTCPRFILVVDSRVIRDEIQVSENEQTAIDNIMLVEADRIAAESARVEAEQSRVNKEKSRVSAENIRKSSETSRASAEQQRVTAETERANAESARNEAETLRENNEEKRQISEEARKNAENNRQAEHDLMMETINDIEKTVNSVRDDANNGVFNGEDYVITEADKNEIVADVLASLSEWTGGAY